MSESGSIAFHLVAPDGQGRVLLLERGDDGVRVTEWRAGAYHLPGQVWTATPADLSARLDEWSRAGYRFSEPPPRIHAWLDD